jgi:hypothetical protein
MGIKIYSPADSLLRRDWMVDRKSAFWILSTLIVCLFVVFIMLVAFIRPDIDTTGITEPGTKAMVENLGHMVWWMTIALTVLPIILLLIAVDVYFYITAPKHIENAIAKANASNQPATISIKRPGTEFKPGEHLSPQEVLDGRYARGELTRDQYSSMKKDIQATRL